MKAKIFSLCALAAAVGLTSCNQNNNGGDDSLEILLSSGVSVSTKTPSTKAPLETGQTYTTYVAGWESATGFDATAQTTWISTADVQVSPDVLPIALNPARQYNAAAATLTHIVGWYPLGTNLVEGTVTAGTAQLTGGLIEFATDGAATADKDVVYAGHISGSRANKIIDQAADNELIFQHKTTQVKFKVTVVEAGLTGVELTSLTLKNAKGPVSLNLADGTMTWNTDPQEFDVLDGAYVVDEKVVNATSDQLDVIGEALMVSPVANNTTLAIDAQVSINGTPLPAIEDRLLVTPTGEFEEGTAYTFLLRISQNGISVKGQIEPWTEEEGTDVDLF